MSHRSRERGGEGAQLGTDGRPCLAAARFGSAAAAKGHSALSHSARECNSNERSMDAVLKSNTYNYFIFYLLFFFFFAGGGEIKVLITPPPTPVPSSPSHASTFLLDYVNVAVTFEQ